MRDRCTGILAAGNVECGVEFREVEVQPEKFLVGIALVGIAVTVHTLLVLGIASAFVCMMLLCNAILQANGRAALPIWFIAIGSATAAPSTQPPSASANVTPNAGQKDGLVSKAPSLIATADGEGKK